MSLFWGRDNNISIYSNLKDLIDMFFAQRQLFNRAHSNNEGDLVNMKIWVDDQRPTPEGYKGFDSTNAALRFIVSNIEKISVLDLDHDMGYSFGGDCIVIMNELERLSRRNTAFAESVDKIKFKFHSMNPVGVQNMRNVLIRNNWTEIF